MIDRVGKTLLFVVGVLALVVPRCAYGQNSALPKINRLGVDGFRLMLQQQGLTATQTKLRTALDSAEDTVAIILGDLKTVTRIEAQLQRFVDEGGALLIASDLRGMKAKKTPICGAWIKPTRTLTSNVRRKLGLQGLADCPIVTEFDKRSHADLFEGVESIVTNRPSEIDISGDVQEIAWLPTQSQPPLMVTYQTQGRMLMVADHSIFINEMLIHGDNARFVNNLIAWLSEDGKRDQLILINDGQVLPDWSFGDTPPAVPLETLLQTLQQGGLGSLLNLLANLPGESFFPFVNESVARYQREDGHNRDLPRLLHFVFGYRLVRTAIFWITALLLLALFRWLMTRSRARRWLDHEDPTKPSEGKLAASIRHQHFLPFCQTMLGEFFFENGATQLSETMKPVLQDASRSSATLQKRIADLWVIATGRGNSQMDRGEFDAIVRSVRELRQLQLSGDLRLEWVASTPTR